MKAPSRSLALVLAPLPGDRALAGQLLQLGHRLGRDEHDVAVAGQQPLDLLQPDLTAAHHDAAAPFSLRQAM